MARLEGSFSSVGRLAVIVGAAFVVVNVLGCGIDSASTNSPADGPQSASSGSSDGAVEGLPADSTGPGVSGTDASMAGAAPVDLHPDVMIRTSLGSIRVRLDAENAPRTVDNFLENYVDRSFYNGTIFHYVDKESMIIGGGFTVDGAAKETRAPIRNESDNKVKNVRGTVAMARHGEYRDSATSQFFVNLVDNPSFDYVDAADEESDATFGYCVFGSVVEGMDVVDQIAKVPVHDTDTLPSTPKEPVIIESINRVPE